MRASKLIGVLVVLAALSARADDAKEQARRDVGAALAAQNAGHYDEAIALYKRAYAAVPHPEILFDLGQAYRLKGDAETAVSYYRRYLAAEPNGRAAPDATRRVAELDKAIADRKRDQARKAEDARKAEGARKAEQGRSTEPDRKADARAIATDRRADPRSVTQARKPDPAASTSEARTAVDSRSVPASGRDAPPASAASTSGPPAPAAGVAGTAQPPTAPPSHYRTAMWISAAGGAGAVIGGLVFGSLALGKHDAALAICGADRVCDSDGDTRRANALLAESRTRGTVSTTLVVLGAAGLATSGALWWLGRRDESMRVVVAPIASPEGLGIALGGAF